MAVFQGLIFPARIFNVISIGANRGDLERLQPGRNPTESKSSPVYSKEKLQELLSHWLFLTKIHARQTTRPLPIFIVQDMPIEPMIKNTA
jgi:hypothetical protein